jgi:hypothetical protein
MVMRKVSEDVTNAIHAILEESDGEPIPFRTLIRLAREKDPRVAYCHPVHVWAVRNLSEDGFATISGSKSGMMVAKGFYRRPQKGPVSPV